MTYLLNILHKNDMLHILNPYTIDNARFWNFKGLVSVLYMLHILKLNPSKNRMQVIQTKVGL